MKLTVVNYFILPLGGKSDISFFCTAWSLPDGFILYIPLNLPSKSAAEWQDMDLSAYQGIMRRRSSIRRPL